MGGGGGGGRKRIYMYAHTHQEREVIIIYGRGPGPAKGEIRNRFNLISEEGEQKFRTEQCKLDEVSQIFTKHF